MAARGRTGLIIVIAVLILAGGAFLWIRHKKPAISEREYATELLAEFLKTAVKPKSVLVIGNPFTDLPNYSGQAKEFERAGIAGLKNGFGPRIPVKVAHPAIKPSVLADPTSVHIDSKSSTPLSFMIESSAFDEVLKANSDCDLAVSIIGLPVNLSSMEAWNKNGPPRFALLLPDWRIIGDPAGIQQAFASGKLVGAVVVEPGSALATDLKNRYFLINSNNVGETLALSPRLFGL
jgi:hypothetical protein